MTKKDFISIADTFINCKPRDEMNPYYEAFYFQWRDNVIAMGRDLANANPRFNKTVWLGYIHGTNTADGKVVK